LLVVVVVVVVVRETVVTGIESGETLNRRTLLLPESTAHRLPDRSNVGATHGITSPELSAEPNPVCVVDVLAVAKSRCPITSEAFILVVVLKGGFKDPVIRSEFSKRSRGKLIE
jgi:hypothetical protein